MNLDFEGRTYGPTEPTVITRQQIRLFCEAIGVGHPACLDVEAARRLGHRDLVAPPTFPVLLTREASRRFTQDPGLELDYSRVVHGEQTFEFTEPILAGDVLTVTVTIESIRTKGSLTFLTNRSDIRSVFGRKVVTGWSTLVER